MKKILFVATLFALAMFAMPQKTEAQYTPFSLTKAATSAGVDSIVGTIQYPGSIVLSAVATMTPISGTSGRIVLMGSNFKYDWTRMDSVTVNFLSGNGANAGTPHEWTFNHWSNSTKLDKPDFLFYRLVFYQATGQVSASKYYSITRTGGN